MNPFLIKAEAMASRLREIRRDLHMHPEPGAGEVRTAGVVAEHLSGLGLEVRAGVGGTGVVGLLENRKDGPTLALRADMDALPMEDAKTVPYASTRKGLVHACGHDAHTAILMGAAELLADEGKRLPGNVKFLFQPAEERPPGGALAMIRDGALEHPRVDGILSLHLHPEFPEGTVSVRAGYVTASSAGFTLRMIGRGGHAAFPHRTRDPVVMAGLAVTGAQTILSRRTSPRAPGVLTFGTVHGGTADNVIPDEVTLTGTIRALAPEDLEELARLLEEVSGGAAAMGGGRAELEVRMEYPSVFNHPELVREFLGSAARVVGETGVLDAPEPSMGGEDVAYFHREVPGVQWRLGTRNPEKGFVHPLHSPHFDFNEEIMARGAAVQAQAAADFLEARQGGPLRPVEELLNG